MNKINLNLEEAQKLANDYDLLPISLEIPSDGISSIEILTSLKSTSSHCFLLESMEDSKQWGRYTFLGYEPKAEITCQNGIIQKNGKTEKVSNPSEYLKGLLRNLKAPKFENLPPFTGGLVGYFAYDYIKYCEASLVLNAKNIDGFYDMDLMLFDKVIAFDNFKGTLFIIVTIETKNIDDAYPKAVEKIMEIGELIANPLKNSFVGKLKTEFKPLFSKDEYCKIVEKAKSYIFEGDIFQAVLSNRWEAEFEGSLLNVYRKLRMINPSPYLFYFSSDKMEMSGASPETLVKLENKTLSTFPLAGTRPRGKTAEEDLLLEQELLSDEKELAEHNMLVDLGRNDLGKISKFGSVIVEKYKSVLRFSHVMHLGSTVKGEIEEGFTGIDAIEAVLPAGTLSGAPKRRACEIINHLENNKRGVYGGAVGYIDFTGNMDTCIAIRFVFKKNGKVFVRSGAGIVADSIPENEFIECQNKARATIEAIRKTAGGEG
ncbi:MAG: anthranilate synthase component I family protein [Eubacteriaceae bacterium]